jgi:hypothetical protein
MSKEERLARLRRGRIAAEEREQTDDSRTGVVAGEYRRLRRGEDPEIQARIARLRREREASETKPDDDEKS